MTSTMVTTTTTTAAATATAATTPQRRRAFQLLNANTIEQSSSNSKSLYKKKIVTPSTTTTTTTTTTTKATPKEENSLDPIKARFDAVCKTRICEDLDDEFVAEEISEWSLDDFEYIRQLGSGGVASVYLAKEKQSGYYVALKIQDANDSDAICEIDIHEPLNHPSIVHFIDFFYSIECFGPHHQPKQQPESDGGSPLSLIMILEYCNQGSLFDIIRNSDNGYLSETYAAPLFQSALQGMAYLHTDHEIIHCDVKSLNFLVHTNGNDKQRPILKMCDFGMAVHYEERQTIGGSPIYMSPEQLLAWRHTTNDFDYRIDTYSLGVMLYEMLVGYLPYEVLLPEENHDDDGSDDGRDESDDDDYDDYDDYDDESDDDESVSSYGESILEGFDHELLVGNLPANISADCGSLLDAFDQINLDGDDDDDDDDDVFSQVPILDFDDNATFSPPVLDLRKLDDHTTTEPFYIPPPIFPEFVSELAQDLIMGLMEPSRNKRMTLSQAVDHEWFRKEL